MQDAGSIPPRVGFQPRAAGGTGRRRQLLGAGGISLVARRPEAGAAGSGAGQRRRRLDRAALEALDGGRQYFVPLMIGTPAQVRAPLQCQARAPPFTPP